MRRSALVAVITLGLLAAACGGGEQDVSGRARGIVALTTTTRPPFEDTDLQFSEEFWHSGFRVELNRAEVWTSTTRFTNRTSYWLTLWGNFENLGDEVASFEPEMAIEESGVAYVNRAGDPPRLLPGTSALGELTFLIPEDLNMETAEFVVGSEVESRARIQLDGSGPSTRLEPIEVAAAGQTATELIDLAVTGGLLSHDVPQWHQQLAAEQRALTLGLGVTSRASSDGQITAEDFSLVLPDGSVVAPAVADLVTVRGAADGPATSNLTVTFIVEADLAGDYVLRLALPEAFVAEAGDSEAMLEFSL